MRQRRDPAWLLVAAVLAVPAVLFYRHLREEDRLRSIQETRAVRVPAKGIFQAKDKKPLASSAECPCKEAMPCSASTAPAQAPPPAPQPLPALEPLPSPAALEQIAKAPSKKALARASIRKRTQSLARFIKLQGIISLPGRRLALVNGDRVTEGSTITVGPARLPVTVIRILEDSVSFYHQGRSFMKRLNQ
ncbi:MAG: hypothetical protein HY924_10735 [Elusimicrobia bacterium]|nr:hypothetical protein [Elusimicrobiota bacterium]